MPGSLADSRCLASWVGRGGIGLAQQPPKQGEPSLETDAGDRKGDNLTDGPPLVDRDHPGSPSRMILPACQSALPPRGGCGAIVPPVRAPHARIARRQGALIGKRPFYGLGGSGTTWYREVPVCFEDSWYPERNMPPWDRPEMPHIAYRQVGPP